jgi:hypothetical protein
LGSIFAGLTWFGITPSSIKMPVNRWLFLMVILWIGSLVFSLYGFYKLSEPANAQTENHLSAADWNAYKLVAVNGKHFRNQKVVLDGKFFSHCTFENVTFEYNGTAPASMTNNIIAGTRILTSTNQGIDLVVHILKDGLHYIPDTMQYLEKTE